MRDAAASAGITLAGVKDTRWNLTGAVGGKTYLLADSSGNTATVATQSFDSVGARDAAVLLYNAHTLGRGKPVGTLLVVGQQLVYVTPANSPILGKVAPLLKARLRS